MASGRLTFFELAAIVKHLPAESAYRTEVRDAFTDEQLAAMSDLQAGHGVWSHSDYLMAALFDAVMHLIHVQMARAGAKADPPEPMRRPGVGVKRGRAFNPQAATYLNRIREIHAAEQQASQGGPG